MRFIPWAVLLIFALLGCSATHRQTHDVSMVRLLAAPESYHGERIRVIGFLRLEFEGTAIYLHREDFKNSIAKNGIWFDTSPFEGSRDTSLIENNMKYVLVEGTFDARSKGHLGLWSGTIRGVTRLKDWSAFERKDFPTSE